MTIAVGVAKQVKYKVESTWGTAPSASGAQLLRRVASRMDIEQDVYDNDEIRTDYQRAVAGRGFRRATGSINGRLSPGTYGDFMASALRRAWTAVSAMSGLSLTIAASGSNYTITRGAGSFLADGVKQGMIGRITAGSVNANNLNKNFVVLDIGSATVITVAPLYSGTTLTAEGPIASCTITIPGKVTYVPASSHTDLSYSIEHWNSDISKSQVFVGMKVATLGVQVPANGNAAIDLSFLGKDVNRATIEYFTSPTALTSSAVMGAVNGRLIVGTALAANVTSINFSVNGNMTSGPVIGSVYPPDIFEGPVFVEGQLTAYFEDTTLRDAFLDGTQSLLAFTLATGTTGTADFLSFVMPLCEINGASVDDGLKGLELTVPFRAAYNSAGGAAVKTEATTIWVQDSTIA